MSDVETFIEILNQMGFENVEFTSEDKNSWHFKGFDTVDSLNVELKIDRDKDYTISYKPEDQNDWYILDTVN